MSSQTQAMHAANFFMRLRMHGINVHDLNSLARDKDMMDELASTIKRLLRDQPDVVAPTEPIEFEDVAILDTDLDVRIQNALIQDGIHSVGVLALHSRLRVGVIPRIGKRLLLDIDDLLNRHGLTYLDELTETMAHKAERYQEQSVYVQEFLAANQPKSE